MDYRSLDDQVRQEGIQTGEERKTKEIYYRALSEGLTPELAHKIAYGDESLKK